MRCSRKRTIQIIYPWNNFLLLSINSGDRSLTIIFVGRLLGCLMGPMKAIVAQLPGGSGVESLCKIKKQRPEHNLIKTNKTKPRSHPGFATYPPHKDFGRASLKIQLMT